MRADEDWRDGAHVALPRGVSWRIGESLRAERSAAAQYQRHERRPVWGRETSRRVLRYCPDRLSRPERDGRSQLAEVGWSGTALLLGSTAVCNQRTSQIYHRDSFSSLPKLRRAPAG